MLMALILTKAYGPAKVQTLLARCFKLLKVFNSAVMLLLVQKIVFVTLQLGHLSVDSASGS